jgi:hypothetical protein
MFHVCQCGQQRSFSALALRQLQAAAAEARIGLGISLQ